MKYPLFIINFFPSLRKKSIKEWHEEKIIKHFLSFMRGEEREDFSRFLSLTLYTLYDEVNEKQFMKLLDRYYLIKLYESK